MHTLIRKSEVRQRIRKRQPLSRTGRKETARMRLIDNESSSIISGCDFSKFSILDTKIDILKNFIGFHFIPAHETKKTFI